jgi:serine/threonine-protein kinase RsbT
MEDEVLVVIARETDVFVARERVRALAAKVSFADTELALIATAISELARNILDYAGRGEMVIGTTVQNGLRGVTVVARDDGPGIADVGLAMQDGYSTGRGLGLGLPGTRRLVDRFDIESAVGRGTTVTITKWAR